VSDFTAPWGWPQWTFLILLTLSLAIRCVNHGEPRSPHNGLIALVDFGIVVFLLTAGGFFS
jgi:hypothetical protein